MFIIGWQVINLLARADDLCEGISKAPLPRERYKAMPRVHHLRKIVTIEPLLEDHGKVGSRNTT
jgi:hypothetical protein